MSKSKKNTDPQISFIWCRCGKIFILADSPPERDIQWSDEGMISAYKFIQKFWVLNEQILKLQKMTYSGEGRK